MKSIKLLLLSLDFLTVCSLLRMKRRLHYLTNANNSEILQNNGRLDLIRITYSHSLGGGTYPTTYSHINKCCPLANVYK